MKTVVEKYHSVEIYFDTDDSMFSCSIKGKGKNSKSFEAVKTWVREYEKENDTFEKFTVYRNPAKSYWIGGNVREIVGKNKEGLFVYINDKTNAKNFISKYDAEDWILGYDGLDRDMGILAIYESELDDAKEKVSNFENLIISKTKLLSDLK